LAEEMIIEDDEFLEDPIADEIDDAEPEPSKPSFDPKQIEELLESSRRSEERIGAMQREMQERARAEEFWTRRQQTQEQPPEPKPKKLEPDEFMDELTTNGVDALAGHFSTPEDVRQIVANTIAETRIQERHTRLLSEYGDLKDANTDFSKRVARVIEEDYGGIIKDKESLLLATERASRRVRDEIQANEGTRRERTSSAGVGRNGLMGSSGTSGTQKPVVLTSTQRQFARMAGIPEKDYLEAYKSNLKERGRR